MKSTILLILFLSFFAGCSSDEDKAAESLLKETWGGDKKLEEALKDQKVVSSFLGKESIHIEIEAPEMQLFPGNYDFKSDKGITALTSGEVLKWIPKSGRAKSLYNDYTGEDFLKELLLLDVSWFSSEFTVLDLAGAPPIKSHKKATARNGEGMVTISWDLPGEIFMVIPGRSPINYHEIFCYISTETRDGKPMVRKSSCEANITVKNKENLKNALFSFYRKLYEGTSRRLELKVENALNEIFTNLELKDYNKSINEESQPYASWEIGATTDTPNYRVDNSEVLYSISLTFYEF